MVFVLIHYLGMQPSEIDQMVYTEAKYYKHEYTKIAKEKAKQAKIRAKRR